jgi:predicted NUDIX family NTP pyrophosphohydrolase
VPRTSAGLLLYRRAAGAIEVLLVHPGGPLWAKKDLGVWSIPKGEIEPAEDPLTAARREFREETGFTAHGPFVPLAPRIQRSGKIVSAWAVEGDGDPARLVSGTFSMEWPPRSGERREFPEVDRAAWFGIPEARRRIVSGQAGLLDELEGLLART